MAATWLKIGKEVINLDITTKLLELNGKHQIVAYGAGGTLVLYEGNGGTDAEKEKDANEQFLALMMDIGAVNRDQFKMERTIIR
jgi:hypothetical protein